MNKRTVHNIVILKLLVLTLVPAGCSRSGLGVQRSTFVCTQQAARSRQHVMEIARDVLAEMYFTIEKADFQNGIVRTRPLPGAQFFEFWRSDNVGADNTFAANLHTIRRTVTLVIRHKTQDRGQKTEDGRQKAELIIDCEVHTQRLSLPEQNLRGDSKVYGMFSQSSRSLQRLKLNPKQAQQMAWIDLGRDSQLEAEIIKRIEAQIVEQTNRRPQTTENKT